MDRGVDFSQKTSPRIKMKKKKDEFSVEKEEAGRYGGDLLAPRENRRFWINENLLVLTRKRPATNKLSTPLKWVKNEVVYLMLM